MPGSMPSRFSFQGDFSTLAFQFPDWRVKKTFGSGENISSSAVLLSLELPWCQSTSVKLAQFEVCCFFCCLLCALWSGGVVVICFAPMFLSSVPMRVVFFLFLGFLVFEAVPWTCWALCSKLFGFEFFLSGLLWEFDFWKLLPRVWDFLEFRGYAASWTTLGNSICCETCPFAKSGCEHVACYKSLLHNLSPPPEVLLWVSVRVNHSCSFPEVFAKRILTLTEPSLDATEWPLHVIGPCTMLW